MPNPSVPKPQNPPAEQDPAPAPKPDDEEQLVPTDPPADGGESFPDDVKVNPQAKGVEIEEAQAILSGPEGIVVAGTHTVSQQVVEEQELVEGTVLSVPPAEGVPNGALVKVTSIKASDDGTSQVITEEATLQDVVEDTHGLVEFDAVPLDSQATTDDDAVELFDLSEVDSEKLQPRENGIASRASIDATRSIAGRGFRADIKKRVPGLKDGELIGGYAIDAKLKLDISLLGGVNHASVTLNTNMDGRLDLAASRAIQEKFRVNVASQPTTYIIMLGPVPVYLQNTAKIMLDGGVDAEGKFDYKPRLNAGTRTGMQYANGNFSPVNDKWFDLVGIAEPNITAKSRLEANLVASNDLSFYNVLNTTGEGRINTTFDVQVHPHQSPRCVINADLYPTARFKAEIPGGPSWRHSIGGEKIALYKSGNLCANKPPISGETEEDLNDVVPDPYLRSYLNGLLGKPEELRDNPISADEIAKIQFIGLKRGYYKATPQLSLEGLQYAKELRSLDVDTTQDDVYIPDLSRLENLDRFAFNVSNGCRVKIDSSGGGFPNLKELHITHGSPLCTNPELEVPQDIANGDGLKEVGLEGPIQNLPPKIFDQTRLNDLKIKHNPLLKALPEDWNLPALGIMEIDDTGLRNLPKGNLNIPALSQLSISHNHSLREIPSSLAQARNLRTLSIWNNKALRSIAPELGSLRELRELRITNNSALSSLTLEPNELTNLGRVQLYSNNLLEFPDFLLELPSLESVTIGGNPGIKESDPKVKQLRDKGVLDHTI